MKRYQALAAEVEKSIHAGILRAGDRLPSVRHLAASRGISASTVFQAYYLLEARGLVRAHERSGYFVQPAPKSLSQPKNASQPEDEAISVDVTESIFRILEAAMTRSVVPFGSAFPSASLFPLARVGAAMASSAKTLTAWDTVDELSPGKEQLRRQIALRYAANGMQVDVADIVITNGALEALNLCLASVARPGDTVIIESPTFYGALQALERLGIQALELPTHPQNGIDLSWLERAISRHKPKACWLMTTFQNPLGCTMPENMKEELVALLARHGIPLIEDDVYAELYFGSKRPLPAKAYDKEGLVLHCSSFSKCLAPGYRIGWAAAGRYTRDVARQKLATTLATSAPAQLGLAKYLERGGFDKHLRKLRQDLASQHEVFAQAVNCYFPAGCRATQPHGGYFMWVELPAGADAIKVHQQGLGQGISVAPGPMFSASGGFANCLRLNFGHPFDERAERALEIVGRIAAKV